MHLEQLPLDILLGHIVQSIDTNQLLALSATCHLMHVVCNDDRLWQHRVVNDFWQVMPRLSGSLRRRPPRDGWKQLYKTLNSQRVYIWGENSDMRLGLAAAHTERDSVTCQIPHPCELRMLRSKGITQLVAGGWSFHALDRRGRVWMWGLMQPRSPFRAVSSSSVDGLVTVPTCVRLPSHVRIRIVSSGRSHAVALDDAGRVWHWSNCWQPQAVPGFQATVVTATWRESAALLTNGRLRMIPYPNNGAPSAKLSVEISVMDDNSDDRILYIAGMAAGVVVLTQKGRLYHVNHQDHRVSEHKLVSAALGGKRLTALSAQHDQFAVVCDTMTVIGSMDVEEIKVFDVEAKDDTIHKIAFGDYHFGALTNKGRLLTWGTHWSSALGRGYEPSRPQVPQAVSSLKEMHVLDAGFGSHHSGCLAVPEDALL